MIIVHIEQGTGLNLAKSVQVEATLSGNKMTSEPVVTGHSIPFNCDLVWETDRKSIKQ